MTKQIFKSNIITPISFDQLDILENHYVIVEDGIITNIEKELSNNEEYIDYSKYIMIPSFSDLHIHASQYVQRGIGMDALLIDWLNNYTFPQEASFSNLEYAKKIYPNLIYDLIKHGTLSASFFTTIHYDACDYFFKLLEKSPMYAYSGKINMDQNSPDYYIEDTYKSIEDTERFILEHNHIDRVKPIITPRFAPTCSEELLMGLGKLVEKYNLAMQTHLVESIAEAAWAKELFPQYLSDGDIYDKCNLLKGDGIKIFAHVIFPEEIEERILNDEKCFAIHCPDATNNIIAGIMPAYLLHQRNIQIAMGSDIGGGHFIGLYRQIAKAIQLSKLKEFYEPENKHLLFKNAFYMATAQGGKAFGNIGKIEVGYKFNTLIIENMKDDGYDINYLDALERFCYIGDDRNIIARYIDGKYIDLDNLYQELLKV